VYFQKSSSLLRNGTCKCDLVVRLHASPNLHLVSAFIKNCIIKNAQLIAKSASEIGRVNKSKDDCETASSFF